MVHPQSPGWDAEGDTPFRVPIESLQPSQLYLDADKLARALAWLAATVHPVSPLPVYRDSDKLILTDGHSRAFGAYLLGYERLWVAWEREALDWDAYAVCVGWCEQAGIRTIADLAGRVLPTESFLTLWVQRCRDMRQSPSAGEKGVEE